MAAPLAVTMGEPASIAGEITLRAWLTRTPALRPFFLLADPDWLQHEATRLGLDVPIAIIDHPDAACHLFAEALPVLTLKLPVLPVPGRPDRACAEMVIASIRHAVSWARQGAACGVITNPVTKQVFGWAGLPHHVGHTTFLTELCDLPSESAVMAMAGRQFLIVPVSVHIPLAEVPARLTSAAIIHAGRELAVCLRRDFRRRRARIAVAGLNPHAGEGGLLGEEEETIIRPAIQALCQEGIAASGPWPADSLFQPAFRKNYEGVLSMYHDQALIPIKTIDGLRAVNVTLGLPILRVSPDHGTALDIAASARPADATGFLSAWAMAGNIARHRAG